MARLINMYNDTKLYDLYKIAYVPTTKSLKIKSMFIA